MRNEKHSSWQSAVLVPHGGSDTDFLSDTRHIPSLLRILVSLSVKLGFWTGLDWCKSKVILGIDIPWIQISFSVTGSKKKIVGRDNNSSVEEPWEPLWAPCAVLSAAALSCPSLTDSPALDKIPPTLLSAWRSCCTLLPPPSCPGGQFPQHCHQQRECCLQLPSLSSWRTSYVKHKDAESKNSQNKIILAWSRNCLRKHMKTPIQINPTELPKYPLATQHQTGWK